MVRFLKMLKVRKKMLHGELKHLMTEGGHVIKFTCIHKRIKLFSIEKIISTANRIQELKISQRQSKIT